MVPAQEAHYLSNDKDRLIYEALEMINDKIIEACRAGLYKIDLDGFIIDKFKERNIYDNVLTELEEYGYTTKFKRSTFLISKSLEISW